MGPLEFEFDWAEISDGGVASGAVVENFDVVEDRELGLVASLKVGSVDQLVLERVPEALGGGVVVAAAAAAHAGDHAVGGERVAVVLAGVLAAAIAVVDESGAGAPFSDRHVEGLQDQAAVHGRLHGPTDDAPGIEVHDRC